MARRCIAAFVTVPSKQVGEEIARALLEQRLAACVNTIPGIQSMYLWEGKVCQDEEQLLMIKTQEHLFEKLKESIVSIHPYDVPEVIATSIVAGSTPYLDWIAASTSAEE
eukprot:m.26579 g.26579  ORF g.26579 m.26579 type:complete len:110 (-) comp8846_c1_seq1:90-419(-)